MIFGMEADYVVPEGWHPVGAVAVVKCLDEEGEPRLFMAGTPTLNSWEAVGMLQGATDSSRRSLGESWLEAEED